MLRQTETAQALAERLGEHAAVTTVRYPGFGGLLSFDVADGDAARLVETGTELIVNATSLGGVTSTIETRFRWEGSRVPPGLLRLSVGLEPVEEPVGRSRAEPWRESEPQTILIVRKREPVPLTTKESECPLCRPAKRSSPVPAAREAAPPQTAAYR